MGGRTVILCIIAGPSPGTSRRAATALVLAALAAACGAAGERPPEEIAREFITSTSPAKCRLLTTELLEEQTGRRGPAALRFCERSVAGRPAPADVRVLEAEVLGGKAQVELVVDQREERIELVRREEGWRIYATPR